MDTVSYHHWSREHSSHTNPYTLSSTGLLSELTLALKYCGGRREPCLLNSPRACPSPPFRGLMDFLWRAHSHSLCPSLSWAQPAHSVTAQREEGGDEKKRKRGIEGERDRNSLHGFHIPQQNGVTSTRASRAG